MRDGITYNSAAIEIGNVYVILSHIYKAYGWLSTLGLRLFHVSKMKACPTCCPHAMRLSSSLGPEKLRL